MLRLKDDLFVEFKIKEAEKVLRDMIGLYNEKIAVSDTEIRKIMSSMREV